MNDELQHLKNLGKTSAQWLHAVGIHSANDLRRYGAVGAYRAVRARGFRASKVLLYAIEGALLNVHWSELPPAHKAELNGKLDEAQSQTRELTTPVQGDLLEEPHSLLFQGPSCGQPVQPVQGITVMYLLGEQPAYADQLINRLQSIPTQLLEGLQPAGEPLRLERVDDLAQVLPGNQIFIIENGLLHALVDERPLLYLQEGDLVGLRQGIDLPSCRYSSEEPISLIPYSRSETFQHIYASEQRQEQFIQYLIGHTALLSDALARLKQPEIRPATGFQHFAAGEELIHQGDEADHVFIIIEGHAEAYVDGQKVGDVQKDEIFGAMAVFTREKRSATVVASEPCTVMVIPKEQFLSLMQSNPRIAHSLIESMARRIDLLNKEVTQLRLPGES